ncbi:PQQ-binding-like beta-propeller repeat protein [Marinifilum sp. D714]|uniref:outer membrane protein assembly factor BamB family protein n=1 Tax=Marinifilum sp. D714 TaxID=2937523 RepID=UPI0027C922CA|nr:PQQ-binding-like beta-propeller repeat protein [Marinifilum sp. D714]MDQ2180701.1 PQQ-binding-like beta-propeller repeat protein [Marinifilum sp. D714]
MKMICKFVPLGLLFLIISYGVYGQSQLLWDFSTQAGIYSSPTIDESTLYIGSNDSCLYALNKRNGSLKWKFKTRGEIKSQPLLHKGSVIFNSTDGLVYSIDKNNAKKQWIFRTEGEKRLDMWDYYLSSPVYANNKIFVGSGDGHIYAIDPNNGELIWKYKTKGIIHASPVVHKETVYVGGFDGFFYALNSENGELVWKFKTIGATYFPKGEIQRGAAIYKNSVIFGSRDYNVYSLNLETGRGMWNMKEKGSWVIAPPFILDDLVYFGTSDSHRFFGLSAKTGHEKHSFHVNMRIYGKAIVFDNEIYFGCFNGKLYKLNQSKEKLEQVFQTHGSKKNYYNVYNETDKFRSDFKLYGKNFKESENTILELGAILSTPVIENGIAYFGDTNGVFYAYKLK